MVYCVAELRNYKQLVRLRTGSLPEVEAAIGSVLGEGAFSAGPGIWAVRMGEEKECSPTAVSQLAWRLREFLSLRRKDLFGYAVLIASIADERRRDQDLRGLLQRGDRVDQIWLAPECASLFEKTLVCEVCGDLLRVSDLRRAPTAAAPVRVSEDRSWAREAMLERALDLLTPRLNDSSARDILLVHGPPGVGKSEFLRQLSFRLLRKTDTAPVRIYTLFRRRSTLHPFLNSLTPQLLAAVPIALSPLERAVWEETGELLKWLRGPSVWAAGPLPDRIEEDFALAYRLYLLSWVRAAEAKGAPAILLCEGIESYHPAARRLLARLIEELMASSIGFLPLLCSTVAQPPEELAHLNVRPLYLHPLGKREIRSLSGRLFAGLDLPEGLARRLRRRSNGRYLTVISYLHYLHRKGRIRAFGDRYQWAPAAGESLPDNPQSVSWYLIRSRPNNLHLLLYVLYLAAGLLDRSGLIIFLAEAGFDLSTVQRYLDDLAACGLVAEPGSPIPRFPALRRKLSDVLGPEGTELRERFISHLWSLWRDGRYNHPVLLFTFLARSGENDRALNVLAEILRRKLDENDVAGAAAFCEADSMEFAAALSPEQRRVLASLTITGRLRSALLENDVAAAHAAQADAEAGDTAAAGPAAEELRIEQAKHLVSRGQIPAAIDELKRCLLSAQDAREQWPSDPAAARGERASYLWLGSAMLADGRIGEAVEYLRMSARLSEEARDASGELWSAVTLSATLFVDGRFTQCLALLDQAVRRSRQVFRHQVELFLVFLQGRTHFELGQYEEASQRFQAGLCLATLYSVEGALPVFRAWLGRTQLHLGEWEAGAALLSSLEKTGEVLLFLAEGALLSRDLEGSWSWAEQSLAAADPPLLFSPEGISWWDGFSLVEGRCQRLSRGGAYLRRLIAGLHAYLQGLRGDRANAVRDLRQMTRGERPVEEDPASYWLNFLYSRILPEAASEETDDKLTVLGKSLKSLQVRASHVDAPAQRSSFLWRNHWNRMIMEEARERKLA